MGGAREIATQRHTETERVRCRVIETLVGRQNTTRQQEHDAARNTSLGAGLAEQGGEMSWTQDPGSRITSTLSITGAGGHNRKKRYSIRKRPQRGNPLRVPKI